MIADSFVGALAMLSFVVAVAFPASAWAKKPVPPPASIGRDPQSWANGGGWYLRLGAPQRDTLATSPRLALLAARTALENDKWEIEPSRDPDWRLTTSWKAIHNLFFRIFSGTGFGRCFVTVRPLREDRVVVTFQGGLATRRDLEHNPMRGPAERSYLSAARVWQREVRKLLAGRPNNRPHHDERDK